MNPAKAQDIARWMLDRVADVRYGSVTVELKIVAGEVRRIERTTMESEQPEPQAVGGRNGKKPV